jgi:hypothetical protein
MIKEYIVSEIRASHGVSPYVFITLEDPKNRVRTPSNPQFHVSSFGSMEDVMENLSKVFTQSVSGGFTTTLKLTENEYKKLDVRVGDRLSLMIDKVEYGSS